jgi:hypothetical protein
MPTRNQYQSRYQFQPLVVGQPLQYNCPRLKETSLAELLAESRPEESALMLHH